MSTFSIFLIVFEFRIKSISIQRIYFGDKWITLQLCQINQIQKNYYYLFHILACGRQTFRKQAIPILLHLQYIRSLQYAQWMNAYSKMNSKANYSMFKKKDTKVILKFLNKDRHQTKIDHVGTTWSITRLSFLTTENLEKEVRLKQQQ